MGDGLTLGLRLAAALGCGLMAGLFFAFSAFVMDGLARLPPAQGVAAMQSINAAVRNPLFAAGFFGSAAACALVLLVSLWRWGEPGAVPAVSGATLYLLGTLLVTLAVNVPLNEGLAALGPADPDLAGRWQAFLVRWTRWNHLRTASALAAAALLILALYQTRPGGA